MTLKNIFIILCVAIVSSCATRETQETSLVPNIIPSPASFKTGNDVLELKGDIAILARSDDEKRAATFLQEFFQLKGINATIASTDEAQISFVTGKNETLGAEGYTLDIGGNGVKIEGNSGAGLFYGVQSLIQMVNRHERKLPYTEITDYPRFEYRGVHLDVSRHMFPAEFIKKYIDLLAHHKFNRFHWHLTEDQGWRIEIKKYPKLQQVAAYREETVIGHASTADRNNPKNFDGKKYGGYYTQEEVKEIVRYAADRYVTIIPEIEMPGHALAALTAYPQLGCTGGPYAVATTWGVFDDVFCAGKEDAFVFLQDVLDEVIALFPGQYIHIGGDECPKTRWEKCPNCQKRIANEKLKDEHELQSYFIQRIEKYLNSKGKQIIGWDEILEGGLAPNATVMSWRGEEGGIAAAEQGHDVIMTPGNWCYFDHYQDSSETEPLAIGGFTDVKEVYAYEPVPPQLSPEKARHVLGAQANVWTEYMKTPEHVEYMVFPRACAMAEVVWSPKEARNYQDFLSRMTSHVRLLDLWDVNYAKHVLKDDKPTTSRP